MQQFCCEVMAFKVLILFHRESLIMSLFRSLEDGLVLLLGLDESLLEEVGVYR